MNYCKLGVGPASFNLRDIQESVTMNATNQTKRLPHKFISKSGKFNRERRYLGQPASTFENPAPGVYHEIAASQASHSTVTPGKSGARFSRQERKTDFIKRASGLEEFTIKGL